MSKTAVIAVVFCLISAAALHGQELRLGLNITVPEGNWFLYHAPDGWHGRVGFLGLAAEVRWYYTADMYLALSIGTLIDFFLPVPAAFDPVRPAPGISTASESNWGIFLAVKNGHRTDSGFCFEYGIAATRVLSSAVVTEDGKRVEEKSRVIESFDIGLAGSIDFIWPFGLMMSLNCLPTFVKIDAGGVGFEYAHLAFIDIGYHFGY